MFFLKLTFRSLVAFILLVLVPISIASDSPITGDKTETEATKHDQSQGFEEVALTQSEIQSRNSAVRVESAKGFGSGTYTIIARRRVVITAAHVISGSSSVSIWGRNGERVRGSVIFVDFDNDFAIISIPKMKTRTPIRFHPSTKHSHKLDKLVGSNVCYTGFPHGHDLLTIRGSVSGIDRGFLMVQSYAWPGSSGSGVFNEYGQFVGVVIAVDVGVFNGSPQIVESMVWIVPIGNIELRLVKSVIEEKIPL